MQPALFLGRDVVDAAGGAECIAAFNARGWLVFVLVNATEDIEPEAQQAMNVTMLQAFAKQGARVDRIYVAPADAPRGSYDRMPRPGLLMRAMTEFQVDKARSLLIGASEDEIAAAKAAGVRGALFTGGDLATFADWALADDR